MRFIIVPIEDMKQLYSDLEIGTMRKSIDGSQVIIHEENLLERRKVLGFAELPIDSDRNIEWTYSNYEYESKALNDLLASKEWNDKEDII